MSGPGAGFEYPPRVVSWLKRDALLFANSIGCKADELHFLFVSRIIPWEGGSQVLTIPGTSPQLCCLPILPRYTA